ncbi:MAG: hypothetical protein ACREBE_22330, partial [bacterium]
FPSMRDLLRALSRDPATIWRRRGIAAAAAATAAVAFVVGRAHSDAAPTCVGSSAEIARSWNPAVRTAMVAHVRGLSPFGAGEAIRLGDELDRYSAAWADEHHRACAAHESGELPSTLYERRIGCLARNKAALTTVAEVMTQVAAADLAPALVAARSLPSATGCTAGDASLVPPPPEAAALQVAVVEPLVERAIVLSIAGWSDAVPLAKASVEAAEKIGYTPLIARALVAQGRAELALNTGELPERQPFEHALDLALRSGDDVLAVEAYARLIFAVQRYSGDVVDNWSVMEAIAARTGTLGRFGRALLYNNKAVARIAANDRAGARALLQQALAAYPIDASASSLSPTDKPLELISVLHNLAQVADDPAEREARIRQVVEQREAVLGAKHPKTLSAWFTAGTLIRNPDAAAAALQTALDGYRQWHPQLAAEIAKLAFERAWLADDRGDVPAARAAMVVAATDPLSPRSPDLGAIAAAYLRITAGDHVDDAAQAMQAVAAAGLVDTPAWWTRALLADAFITSALGWERLGRQGDAERCWSGALTQLELVK